MERDGWTSRREEQPSGPARDQAPAEMEKAGSERDRQGPPRPGERGGRVCRELKSKVTR